MGQNNKQVTGELEKANEYSMAPSIKTKEAAERDETEKEATENRSKPVSMNKFSITGTGTGIGVNKGIDDPQQADPRAESLGTSPPSVGSHGFKDMIKAEDESSELSPGEQSEHFKNSQSELKKDLQSLPKVTSDQGNKKDKAPIYDMTQSGTLGKSINITRLKLAWDLHHIARTTPEDLIKNDPIKKEFNFRGLDICIEWPKGTVRKYRSDGVLKDGKTMKADYGYFKNTITEDKEELDCYVGTHQSDKVFLLMQKPTPWDIQQGLNEPEEKYMLGFRSSEEAKTAYMGSMPSKFFDSITEVDWEAFIARLQEAKVKRPQHKALKKSFEELNRLEQNLIPKLVIKI